MALAAVVALSALAAWTALVAFVALAAALARSALGTLCDFRYALISASSRLAWEGFFFAADAPSRAEIATVA